MSRYVSFQPGHLARLLPEDFASDPTAGIGGGVSGLLANNVRRLEIVFINYHEMGNFNQRIGGVKRSNQINCRHLLATEDLWESLTEGQMRPAYLLVSIKLDLYPETSLPRGQALVKKLQVKKKAAYNGSVIWVWVDRFCDKYTADNIWQLHRSVWSSVILPFWKWRQ